MKNKRKNGVVSNYEIGIKSILPQANTSHLFKSVSSHTSSLKTIQRLRHSEFDLVTEKNQEDLHSSSSADTVAIKDKIVVSNMDTFKNYNRTKTKKICEFCGSKA
jgi:hypothetical protein